MSVAREPDGGFAVEVTRAHDAKRYRAANVVFATGYYDNPNFLRVPGEELPHVAHYFLEGHPYWHRRVIVIGAGNSSVDAALECWRAGATVTLVHFGEGFDRTVKAWVLPDITNRVKEGSIAVRWRSRIRAITPTDVEIVSEIDRRRRAPAGRRRAGHDRLPCRYHDAPAARRPGRRGDRGPGARRADDGHAGARASTWPASSPAATTPTGCSSRMPAGTGS